MPMRPRTVTVLIAAAAALPLLLVSVPVRSAPARRPGPPQEPPAIAAVPFHQVRVADPFWTPRLQRNREVTIPHDLEQCWRTQRIDNFLVAGKQKPGGMTGYFFNDSDVYKVVEGAAHELRRRRDPALEARIDEIVDAIAAAQEPDGYLYTSRTIGDPDNPPLGGPERWSNMDHGHELYNVGHLYEAAVAYAAATGKAKLLAVAQKNAELVLATFGPEGNPYPCGHPEIELGLLALHRHTGEQRYLDQARWFLDARGRTTRGRHLFGEYSQDHAPLLQQDAIVGHAVRAAYLLAAAAEVGRITGAADYVAVSARLWDDMAGSQVYLTGGIGSQGSNEGFGARFQLPNRTGYGETCASIANALWSQRLFLATGEARYLDMVEAVLFNAFHSGWSLSGDRFFYPNPLESRGAERQAWFACACCPPNVARFVPQIPGLCWATSPGAIWLTQFLGGETELTVDGLAVRTTLESRYPWDGALRLRIDPAEPREFALRVRIPGWTGTLALPGGLYRHVGVDAPQPKFRLNGAALRLQSEDGWAVVHRRWQQGDVLELELPMPVRRVHSSDRVTANRGLVALRRGPLIYCCEGIDQPQPEVRALVLPDAAAMRAEHRDDLLGGVTVLHTTGRVLQRNLDGSTTLGEPVPVQAIPYFAWANRGRTPMAVWLAREPAAAVPLPAPTLAHRSRVTASFTGDLEAVRDQREPAGSGDPDSTWAHWWPHKGTSQWLQYDLPERATISGVEVYWFDDTGRGECRVPARWSVQVRVAGEWRDIAADGEVAPDRWCRATFAPVQAEAVRLQVQSQPGWAGGVHEWRLLPAGDGG